MAIIGSAPRAEDIDALVSQIAARCVGDELLRKATTFATLRGVRLYQGNVVTDAGIAHLLKLPNLRALTWIQAGHPAGLKHIGQIKALETLYVYGSAVTDDSVAHLKGLTGLQTLVLADGSMTDAGLEHLAGLTNLTNLGFNDCPRITGTGLVHLHAMKRLGTLAWRDTSVTDDSLKHLAPLQTLKTILLDDSKVTQAGVEALKAHHPPASRPALIGPSSQPSHGVLGGWVNG